MKQHVVSNSPISALEGLDHRLVIIGRRDDRHVLKVFCSSADERRTTDINVLNRIFEFDVRLPDCFSERVQIDTDEIDQRKVVLRDLLHVRSIVSNGQHSPSDARVKSLYPAVEN